MRYDPVLAADDVAGVDHRHAEIGVERDVDPLTERHAAHVDRAVADRDGGPADVNAVELRTHDCDVVDVDAVVAVDRDPVLTSHDGDVADSDVIVADDDAAEHDRAGIADEVLAPVDEERALVYAGAEPHRRRQVVPPEPARGAEGDA